MDRALPLRRPPGAGSRRLIAMLTLTRLAALASLSRIAGEGSGGKGEGSAAGSVAWPCR
jgi:hypothetical protein